MTIDERVASIISFEADWPPDRVTPRVMIDRLGFDSLDFIDVLCKLEVEFQIEIPTAAAADCQTVGELTGLIGAMINRARAERA